MQKESFVFKSSWLLAIEGYASNVRCEFYEAVFAYLSCGRTVDLVSGGAKRAFASVKRDIDCKETNDFKETKEGTQENKENNNNNNLDVKAFVLYFNETLSKAGAMIPHRCTVTVKRRAAVKARCKEYGKDSLKVLVEKAAYSDFLNGHNNLGWVASLDWLLRPNNFVKVIEGNYDNDKTAINCKSNNYGNTNKSTNIDPRRGTDASNVAVEEYEKGF